MTHIKKYFFVCPDVVLFVVLLLCFLGFQTSCKHEEEYGIPTAKFIVKGTVKSDSTGQAVQGIRVSNGLGTSVLSSSIGTFQISTELTPAKTVKFVFNFYDLDSTLNGSFKDTLANIEFFEPQYTGGDGEWYLGEITKTVDVRMKNAE